MAAWLNEVVVRAVALLSALTKEFDADYSVVKWQLYKPAMDTEYDQQSPRECFVRHVRSDERVDRHGKKFAFYLSFERPTRTK